jgi:hypothetical protein
MERDGGVRVGERERRREVGGGKRRERGGERVCWVASIHVTICPPSIPVCRGAVCVGHRLEEEPGDLVVGEYEQDSLASAATFVLVEDKLGKGLKAVAQGLAPQHGLVGWMLQ